MTIHHRTAVIEGLEIFYREAGDPSAPTLLLLHGFPTSSAAYKGLIAELAGEFHLIAPDYPGFGHSEAPAAGEWDYTFDHFADIVDGLLDHLRVTGIISQNGNAYTEGLTPFWDQFRPYWEAPDPENTKALRGLLTPEATRWQYTHGVPDTSLVDPDLAVTDQAFLDRPGNAEIQLALFADYGVNPGRYPAWQRYLREHRPPVLAVWGRGDEIFGPEGATAFTRDQPDATVRLLDAGHFPLTTHLDESARLIAGFLRGLSR